MIALSELEAMTHNDPYQVLGIPLESGDEQIRAAYLRKVKEFPPDRAPREFEKVRDAYDLLRDPRRRARHMMLSIEAHAPIVSLLDQVEERRFLGPEPWLAVLREDEG